MVKNSVKLTEPIKNINGYGICFNRNRLTDFTDDNYVILYSMLKYLSNRNDEN